MNLNNMLSGLYGFADAFYEQMKPFNEMIKTIEQNFKTFSETLAEKTKPIRAFYILAEHQFTYWMPLYSDDIEHILTVNDVDKYLMEKINDISFIDYNRLRDEMLHSPLLSDVNKAILSQSIQAIDNNLYDLALIGIVTVFDGVLSVATNDPDTSIPKRLNKIKDKMESLSDDEWELLEESDITAFGMYITWTESMKGFQKRSDFKKPEDEPKDLNRHWISHGRKTLIATKLTCCKMINALYGLIYFGNSI